MSERGVMDVYQELAVLYERRQQLASDIMEQNVELADIRQLIVEKEQELSDLRYPAGAAYIRERDGETDD